MKSINKIPTSKIQRASKIISTGAKVGGNYVKYFGNRITKSKEDADNQLDIDNAEDIYDGLQNLKGSALKMAQMMSMDKSVLPKAYVEKFSLSQFSVPPLSGPLIVKTFRRYFNQSPDALFDEFNMEAVNAASIGQVHQAKVGDQKLAVKIQYPGVADSISSDLALVKPFALKMLNMKSKEADVYFKEVEQKLIEETDYLNELQQGQHMAENCAQLENIRFPKYYPEYSCDKVITMEWMEGEHLSEFYKREAGSPKAAKVAQSLWDFYMYQLHVLKTFHADPHPGNFLVDPEGNLIVLDFGCLKTIPEDFHEPYFELIHPENISDTSRFQTILLKLEVLKKTDSEDEVAYLQQVFKELLSVFTKPFLDNDFDFSDTSFFQEVIDLGERFSKDKTLRDQNGGRGSKHFIYMNRTLFGLYNLMFDLKSKVGIHTYGPKSKVA